MTDPEAGGPAAELRREFRAIAELLEGTPPPAAREEGKRRIIALFRAVDAALGELGPL